MTETGAEFGDDIIDLRDCWKRYQELLAEVKNAESDDELEDVLDGADVEEYQMLRDLFDAVGQPNADGEFESPILIEDSYFQEYAEQVAIDTGAVGDIERWPATCIDWDEAVDELQQDYTSYDIGDYTYWRENGILDYSG